MNRRITRRRSRAQLRAEMTDTALAGLTPEHQTVLSGTQVRELLQLDTAMDQHLRYNHVPYPSGHVVSSLKRLACQIVRRFNGMDPGSEPDHDLDYVVDGVTRRDGSPITAQEFVEDWHLHDFLNIDE